MNANARIDSTDLFVKDRILVDLFHAGIKDIATATEMSCSKLNVAKNSLVF